MCGPWCGEVLSSPLPSSRQTPERAASGKPHVVWHSLAGSTGPACPRVSRHEVPSDIGPAWEVLPETWGNHRRDVPSSASDTSWTRLWQAQEQRGRVVVQLSQGDSTCCNLESYAENTHKNLIIVGICCPLAGFSRSSDSLWEPELSNSAPAQPGLYISQLAVNKAEQTAGRDCCSLPAVPLESQKHMLIPGWGWYKGLGWQKCPAPSLYPSGVMGQPAWLCKSGPFIGCLRRGPASYIFDCRAS